MRFSFDNNYSVTLTADITATQQNIPVSSVNGLPIVDAEHPLMVTLEVLDTDLREIIEVYSIDLGGLELNALRGRESTQLRAFSTGDIVQARLTADILQKVQDEPLRWAGQWSDANNPYDPNEVTRDNEWTMVCVDPNGCTDRPSPQNTGDAEYIISPGATFATASDTSVVTMVHELTVTTSGFLQLLQVRVPAWDLDSVSRITLINVSTGYARIISNPVLEVDDWTTILAESIPVVAGTVLRVEFMFYNASDVSSIVGSWTAAITTGVPAGTVVNIDSATNPTVIVIDDDDIGGTSHTAALAAVAVGSVIHIHELGDLARSLEASVVTTTPGTGNTSYAVTVIDTGIRSVRDGKICSIRVDIPPGVPSQYSAITGYFPGSNPTFGTVTTELYYDAVQQASVTDAYGINMLFQPAEVSPQWELFALYGGGSGGGGNIAGNIVYADATNTLEVGYPVLVAEQAAFSPTVIPDFTKTFLKQMDVTSAFTLSEPLTIGACEYYLVVDSGGPYEITEGVGVTLIEGFSTMEASTDYVLNVRRFDIERTIAQLVEVGAGIVPIVWPSANDYVYDNAESPVVQGASTFISFNPSGTKFVAMRGDQVAEFDVDTAWDASTINFGSVVYNANWNISSLAAGGWTDDGGFFFGVKDPGATGQELHKLTAASAYSPTGGAAGTSVNIDSFFPVNGPLDAIYVKNDGTSLFINTRNPGNTADMIQELTMSPAWDITTLALGKIHEPFGGCSGGLWFQPDGKRLYTFDGAYFLRSWPVSTAWDLDTVDITADGVFDMRTAVSTGQCSFFREDGERFYSFEFSTAKVHQYKEIGT